VPTWPNGCRQQGFVCNKGLREGQDWDAEISTGGQTAPISESVSVRRPQIRLRMYVFITPLAEPQPGWQRRDSLASCYCCCTKNCCCASITPCGCCYAATTNDVLLVSEVEGGLLREGVLLWEASVSYSCRNFLYSSSPSPSSTPSTTKIIDTFISAAHPNRQ
jgi:hypothetical protein